MITNTNYPANQVLEELKCHSALLREILSILVVEQPVDDYITIKKTMELLKISRSTLNRWLAKGILEAKKVGDVKQARVLILRRSVDDLLNRKFDIVSK